MRAYGDDIVAVIALKRVIDVNGDVSSYPTDLLFRCPGIEHPGLCTTSTCETLCKKYTRCTRITDMLDYIKLLDGDGGGFCKLCGEFINSGCNCYRVEGLGDCCCDECLKKAMKLKGDIKVTKHGNGIIKKGGCMNPGHLLGMTAVISVMPDGSCACLQTDLIDLAALGRLHVERATEVEFDNDTQEWVVTDMDGTELYRHKFRDVCLNWERDYIVKREDAKHGGVT